MPKALENLKQVCKHILQYQPEQLFETAIRDDAIYNKKTWVYIPHCKSNVLWATNIASPCKEGGLCRYNLEVHAGTHRTVNTERHLQWDKNGRFSYWVFTTGKAHTKAPLWDDKAASFLCCVPDLCQFFLFSILSDMVFGKVCWKASVGLTPWVLTSSNFYIANCNPFRSSTKSLLLVNHN